MSDFSDFGGYPETESTAPATPSAPEDTEKPKPKKRAPRKRQAPARGSKSETFTEDQVREIVANVTQVEKSRESGEDFELETLARLVKETDADDSVSVAIALGREGKRVWPVVETVLGDALTVESLAPADAIQFTFEFIERLGGGTKATLDKNIEYVRVLDAILGAQGSEETGITLRRNSAIPEVARTILDRLGALTEDTVTQISLLAESWGGEVSVDV